MSSRAHAARLDYIADAYNLDLDDKADAEAAGYRNTVSAAKLTSRRAAFDLYRRTKSGRWQSRKTGKFVSRKRIRNYIVTRQRREEIKLLRRMFGYTETEARDLRRNRRKEFDALLGWRQKISPDIDKNQLQTGKAKRPKLDREAKTRWCSVCWLEQPAKLKWKIWRNQLICPTCQNKKNKK